MKTFRNNFDLKKSKDYRATKYVNGEPLIDGLKERTKKNTVNKKYKY